MDEIEKRLREATDACIGSLENWNKQGKSLEARESLMETVHEVRKVIARVEIEIAISERDRLGSRPLPIPPHRSSRKSSGGDDTEAFDDFAAMPQPDISPMRQNMGGERRPHQGNRDGGGRGRRPMGQRNNNASGNQPGGNDGGNGNGNGPASEG